VVPEEDELTGEGLKDAYTVRWQKSYRGCSDRGDPCYHLQVAAFDSQGSATQHLLYRLIAGCVQLDVRLMVIS